jgi:hypothetical protein
MRTKPKQVREDGRIRIGNRVSTSKGGTRPNKLETFRLTSSNMVLLKKAAEIMGGEPKEWAESPNPREYELYTEVNSIDCVIPPSSSFSQTYEIWGAKGGGREILCNGCRILQATPNGKYFNFKEKDIPDIIGSDCLCSDENPVCPLITRVTVMLPDLIGSIGGWRLETKSTQMAGEMEAIINLLESASLRGQYIKCTLNLEQRSSFGAEDGSRRRYPVVTLSPSDVSAAQLMLGDIPQSACLATSMPRHRIAAPAQQISEIASEDLEEMAEQAKANLFGDDDQSAGNVKTAEMAVTDTAEIASEPAEVVPDKPKPEPAPKMHEAALAEVYRLKEEYQFENRRILAYCKQRGSENPEDLSYEHKMGLIRSMMEAGQVGS